MSNKLAQLMEKEMDRRDFLKYGIGVILALVGITGLLRTLTGEHQSNGYGDRPYGQ